MDFTQKDTMKADLFNSFKGSTGNTSGGSGKPAQASPKPTSTGFTPAVKPTSASPPTQKPAATLPSTPTGTGSTGLGRTTSSTGKTKFICQKCGYKFSLDPTVHQKLDCPWCGYTQQKQ